MLTYKETWDYNSFCFNIFQNAVKKCSEVFSVFPFECWTSEFHDIWRRHVCLMCHLGDAVWGRLLSDMHMMDCTTPKRDLHYNWCLQGHKPRINVCLWFYYMAIIIARLSALLLHAAPRIRLPGWIPFNITLLVHCF